MEKCFICGEASYKCEMSVYRPTKEETELICSDCRNDINKG